MNPIAGPAPRPSRRAFLGGVLGVAAAAGVAGCSTAESGGRPLPVEVTDRLPAGQQPNLVVILSDDHRADSMSCASDPPPYLSTPNLDRLAGEGVIARNAFVTTALCSPSRGTFLSGEYASKHTVTNNLTPWNPATPTFFEPLMAAGYNCAFIGKWHMPGALPDLRGVNRFITFTAQEGQGQYLDCPLLIDGTMTPRPGTYITTDLTTLALEWIDAQPKDQPWCLYLAHKAVHHQWVPPAEFAGTMDAVDMSDLPDEAFAFMSLMDRNIWEGTRGQVETHYRHYLETILGLDQQIGRLVDHLDASGVRDDTYVVYSSDNGYSWGEHVLTGKRWAYEENTKVPFIVTGPGIPAGTETREMILNADLASTLTDWGSAGAMPGAMGKSLRTTLDGTATAPLRDEFLYEYFPDFPYNVPGLQAVRTPEWLYVEYDRGLGPELYDVVTDPQTQRNLIEQDPAKASQLAAQLNDLRQVVAAGGTV